MIRCKDNSPLCQSATQVIFLWKKFELIIKKALLEPSKEMLAGLLSNTPDEGCERIYKLTKFADGLSHYQSKVINRLQFRFTSIN